MFAAFSEPHTCWLQYIPLHALQQGCSGRVGQGSRASTALTPTLMPVECPASNTAVFFAHKPGSSLHYVISLNNCSNVNCSECLRHCALSVTTVVVQACALCHAILLCAGGSTAVQAGRSAGAASSPHASNSRAHLRHCGAVVP